MDVEDLGRDMADGGDDLRPEGDVGHEMPVHDVEMDPVGAGGVDARISSPSREKSDDNTEGR